ncbi:hypothetical protein [Streptomyces sp. MH60]|uniref:hypothetical protein n=1 Tax=Streptomyces sp. MH60 TaxID=1940758 RepID=UPI000D4EA29F|nr:hypothetical protein [Streptomyces sp. MH60]PPS91484.1 hypothetical protein BZZ08_00364 [Streptomyces sp. MH60]
MPSTPASSVCACGSGGTEIASRAAAPLHPPPVFQHSLCVVDAGAFEEHHEVVIAVGGAEYLVPAVTVHAVQAPAAVLALTAVAEPPSLDRTALAEAALRSAESDADPAGACDALEALGLDALTDDHARRLAALADGDARVVRSGIEDRVIHQDETLRNRARSLLTACPDTAAP